MLAMHEEEMFVAISVLTGLIVVAWLLLNYGHKANRLKTIEKAIAADHIDDNTRRSILDALAADAQRQGEFWQRILKSLPRIIRGIIFICGWLTLVIGGGCWCALEVFGSASRYDVQGAMIATFIGFALVSLPLAMRELEGRRAEVRP